MGPWVALSRSQIDRLWEHYQLLLRWNKKINLTTVRPGRETVLRHYCESLFFGAHIPSSRKGRDRILDFGSGAGFPGLPLAAALPHVSFVLLESSARRCSFLERTTSACGFSNATAVHERAELYDAGRDSHDLVTTRAVARLNVTAEYAAPLLRISRSVSSPPSSRTGG